MMIILAFLLFISFSSALGLVISHFQGVLTESGSVFSFSLAFLLSALFFLSCTGFWPKRIPRFFSKFEFKLPKLYFFDYLMAFLFLIFHARQFLWIYFFRDGALATLNVNNYGDLPLHLTYILRFVNGAPFWPANPIFAYDKLHYPFGVDLLTAMVVKLGVPLETVLPVIGMSGAIATLFALLLWGRGFLVGSFLFAGGLAGFEIISSHILKDYQAELAWKSLTLSMFIPQRGFLFAFPMGLLLLWSWRQKFLQNKKGLPNLVDGILYGALPLIHLHTFIFLTMILPLWAIAQKMIKKAIPIVVWAFVPATYQVLMITGFFKQSSILWIESGWMIHEQNVIWFFLKNYGLFIPVTWYACYLSFKLKSREHILMILSAFSIFYMLLFVMFAPWDWDNNKLMVWCYLLALPVAAELFTDKLKPVYRYGLYSLMFFSGAISLLSTYVPSNRGSEIIKLAELRGVCQSVKRLDPTGIFAVVQTHNHPVALCGQNVVVGYEGHLWSYGIKSEPVVKKLKLFMDGDDHWSELAKSLNIKYVFWGDREKVAFPNSKLPEILKEMKLSEGPWGKIFELKDLK